MTETPHFLRVTRTLALGVIAVGSTAACTPAPDNRVVVEPSAGSNGVIVQSPQQIDSPPQGSATADPAGSAVARPALAPAGAPRDAAGRDPTDLGYGSNLNCSSPGERRTQLRETQLRDCECRQIEIPNEPVRRTWSCEDIPRMRGALEGQSCAQLDERRTITRGNELDVYCRCVRTAPQRLSWVCLGQYNVAVGPCAPPDWPA